jgi:hypothetical protein
MRRDQDKEGKMTDLALSATHGDRNATNCDNKPLKLLIVGNEPTTVWVTQVSATVAGFSLTQGGTPVTGGIRWKHNEEFGMFVLFQLSTDIASIDCDALSYSPVFRNASGAAQFLCIPATNAEFPFLVKFTSGGVHDPKIVVTPINSM